LLKDNKCYQLILKLFDKDVPGQEYKGRVEIVDIPKFRTAIQKAKLSAEEMELIQWTEMPNWVKNEKLDILIVKDADP
jgi:hypothetical protein